MRIIVITLFLLLFACAHQPGTESKHILNFGAFSIETPTKWKKIETHGIDSYVGRISLDSSDTLHFDLGAYSNKLNDYIPPIYTRSELHYFENIDTSEIIIVENARLVDRDKYRKTNISWDSIDGRQAKIIYPIRSGTGTTGIYIDTLQPGKEDTDHFNLYGINLKPENEKLFLQAVKTLKFRRQ